jgi:hypothetical protein
MIPVSGCELSFLRASGGGFDRKFDVTGILGELLSPAKLRELSYRALNPGDLAYAGEEDQNSNEVGRAQSVMKFLRTLILSMFLLIGVGCSPHLQRGEVI